MLERSLVDRAGFLLKLFPQSYISEHEWCCFLKFGETFIDGAENFQNLIFGLLYIIDSFLLIEIMKLNYGGIYCRLAEIRF